MTQLLGCNRRAMIRPRPMHLFCLTLCVARSARNAPARASAARQHRRWCDAGWSGKRDEFAPGFRTDRNAVAAAPLCEQRLALAGQIDALDTGRGSDATDIGGGLAHPVEI